MHERYERFFRLLGANNNQAKALSVAQIYGLLDDPYDKNIKRAVSEVLKNRSRKFNGITRYWCNELLMDSWCNTANEIYDSRPTKVSLFSYHRC